MMNVIKTAIVTIIISIISGLLLERFKSFAPRILCNVGDRIPIKVNNKKVYAYVITVSNLSKKIIHELTLNIQSPKCSLKIADSKITKGLKFDSSVKNNSLDIDIPFLSKGDKFSVTVYVENQYGVCNKPVVVMRSPENFKEIDSEEENGILASLFNIPKNASETTSNVMQKDEDTSPYKENDDVSNVDKPWQAERTINKRSERKNKSNFKLTNRKKIIIAASVVLVVLIGILGVMSLTGNSNDAQTQSAKSTVQNASDNSAASTNGTNENAGTKTSTGRTTKNTGTKTQTGGAANSTGTSTQSSGSATESTGTSSQQSSGGSSGNSDTKASSSETTKSSTTNTSTGTSTEGTGTTQQSGSNKSSGTTGTSTQTNTEQSGTTGNTSK